MISALTLLLKRDQFANGLICSFEWWTWMGLYRGVRWGY